MKKRKRRNEESDKTNKNTINKTKNIFIDDKKTNKLYFDNDEFSYIYASIEF